MAPRSTAPASPRSATPRATGSSPTSVGSMIQSKGTSQGTFFDTKDMKPLIDNEAFRKALDFLKELGKYGPPDELNMDVSDTRPLFVSGKCALNLDWGDVGVLAIDPKASKVIDKTGSVDHARLEGSAELGDRQARGLHPGQLPLRDRRRQPCAVRGVRRLERRHQRQGQGRASRTPPTPSCPTCHSRRSRTST